jgi:UDP-N-acetylmuramate--alanine ligase
LLEAEGTIISYHDDPKALPVTVLGDDDVLYIYTPAIPAENQIKLFLESRHNKLYKRSEILGFLSEQYESIGIAGTHGKTTVSSMTAHILHGSSLGCQAFLGGIAKNYNSNLLTHPTSQWMVVEADEYDRSFLKLHPQIALITAMDADHLDIYGTHDYLIESFRAFANQRKQTGKLVINNKLAHHFPDFTDYITYGLTDAEADFAAENIRLIEGKYHFDLRYPQGTIRNIVLNMPGIVNLENAVAASTAALLAGVSPTEIKEGLAQFEGIQRRLELITKTTETVYYDDYAHHPEEINAALKSLRLLYPDKKMTVIFQPHLFSRTRDFADGFAQSLSQANEIILLDIYPAREKPLLGVTSHIIFEQITNPHKKLIHKDELIDYIAQARPELLVTLGAGDIDRLVEPLKEMLNR